MIPLRKCGIFALTILSIASTPPTASADTLSSQIDAIFAPHNRSGVPGASIVVTRNGQVTFKSAYGFADVRRNIRVSTDTAFHFASAGKQMTALAIMMLSHQGRLSIDDHVVKHLPVFRKWGEKVIIRHLLYHTSGLPDYYDDIEDEFSRPTNSQALQFLSSLGYLKFRPGAKFDYSNSGYDTLGALIQKVSGQRFGDFMNSHIFAPAGMTNSFAFDNSRRKASKRALGYALDRGKYSLDDTSPLNLMHGSGSIYASVEDLAKYDAALFGYQYLPKVVLDQSFVSGATNRGSSIGYGFGWELGNDNDINQPYYGHSGEWMGFSSYYLRYPTLSLSVIVLANCSDTDAEAIAFESAHAVLENR